MTKLPLILALCLAAPLAAAADIYIDPSKTDPSEDGTPEHPYDSWTDFTIATGNDYRQKCGSVAKITSSIRVTNSGASNDHIVVGAYYTSAGSPIHEDDSPSFGENCGNGAAKPTIENNDYDNSVMNIDANYIELNSLQLKKGSTTVYMDGDYNEVKYCRVGWGYWGIRIGLSSSSQHNYVGYSYVFTNTGEGSNTDGINMHGNADHALIEYNVVDGWDHACIATGGTTAHGSHHEVRYNYVLSWDDIASECLQINGSYGNWHHNWCEDSGVVQIEGTNHAVWANVVNNTVATKENHSAISMAPITQSVEDNLVANNVVYFDGTQGATMRGIRLGCVDRCMVKPCIVERNRIANNIVLHANTYTFDMVYDLDDCLESDPDDPDVNTWRNNIAYGWTSKYAARGEGPRYYKTITDQGESYFNSEGDNVSDNSDADPGLKGAAVGQLWPDEPSDGVMGNGLELGAPYDQLLDPKGTDFAALPPRVAFTAQPAGSWTIGAYGLEGTVADADGGLDGGATDGGATDGGADVGTGRLDSGIDSGMDSTGGQASDATSRPLTASSGCALTYTASLPLDQWPLIAVLALVLVRLSTGHTRRSRHGRSGRGHRYIPSKVFRPASMAPCSVEPIPR